MPPAFPSEVPVPRDPYQTAKSQMEHDLQILRDFWHSWSASIPFKRRCIITGMLREFGFRVQDSVLGVSLLSN